MKIVKEIMLIFCLGIIISCSKSATENSVNEEFVNNENSISFSYSTEFSYEYFAEKDLHRFELDDTSFIVLEIEERNESLEETIISVMDFLESDVSTVLDSASIQINGNDFFEMRVKYFDLERDYKQVFGRWKGKTLEFTFANYTENKIIFDEMINSITLF
jgi:hypothetical protein